MDKHIITDTNTKSHQGEQAEKSTLWFGVKLWSHEAFWPDHPCAVPRAFLVGKLPSMGGEGLCLRAYLLSLPGKPHNCTAGSKAASFSSCLLILWHVYTAGAAVMALWCTTSFELAQGMC